MEYLTHTGGGEVDENDENCGSTNNNVIFPNLQEQLTHNVFQSGGGDFSCRHIPKQSVDTSSTKWHGYNPERTQGVFIDIHLYGNVYIFPWGNLQYASNPQDAAYRSIMGQLLHYTGLKAHQAVEDHYGVASGCTDDWAYATLGSLSMTWELGLEFHEPCEIFEQEYDKHFPAFWYLAKIAPLPYTLGRGPIIHHVSSFQYQQQTIHDNTLALYYYNDIDMYDTTTKKLSSMGTNTVQNIYEIMIVIQIDFPKGLQATMPLIVFDDNDDDDTNDENNDDDKLATKRSIDKIRVYYKNNLLASLDVIEATYHNDDDDDGDGNYWDVPFYEFTEEEEENKDEEASFTTTTYVCYINKDQFWSAFGRGENNNGNNDDTALTLASSTSTMNHLLYIQAMDNNGWWGPITATSVNIMLLQQEQQQEMKSDDTKVDHSHRTTTTTTDSTSIEPGSTITPQPTKSNNIFVAPPSSAAAISAAPSISLSAAPVKSSSSVSSGTSSPKEIRSTVCSR